MRRKKDKNPRKYERSGGLRAWYWVLVQLAHSWYQSGPMTPNTMDVQQYFAPHSRNSTYHDAQMRHYWPR